MPGMLQRRARTGSALALVGAAILVLGLAACGDDDDDGGATGDGSTSGAVAVSIEGFEFAAQPVAADSSFEVENNDSAEHTFTADDGAFDVDIAGGETETVDAPAEPGTYAFHCELHSSMTGELTVE
jgi:plastocyanin